MKFSKLHPLLLALMIACVQFSCDGDDDAVDDNTVCNEWNYKGEEAFSKWESCYADCAGTDQSPIDITGAVESDDLLNLNYDYKSVPVDVINNGHNEEFEYEPGSSITMDGKTYNLVQFHFHTASEHTFNGVRYPMEAHLVHKNDDGKILVLAVVFTEGADNAFLTHFVNNLPAESGGEFESEDMVNVKDLLPTSHAYYTYQGSLTTPPCSEIATWVLLESPVTASVSQIDAVHARVGDNYRPIHPLNGRVIKEHS